MAYIVLATTSDSKAQVFGPFKAEATADRWARKQNKAHPLIDWLPLPITPRAQAEL